MVAMGTSLSDGAWGRESAVYRITGVITVVGGWFLTAFIAFTASFFIAMGLYFGGMLAIIGFIVLSVFILIRTHSIHKKRENANHIIIQEEKASSESIMVNCNDTVRKVIVKVAKLYYMSLLNFTKENRKELQQIRKDIKSLNQETKLLKDNIHLIIRKLKEDEIDSGHYYVQVLDYLRETTNCLYYVVNPIYSHVDNNHPPLAKEQEEELMQFNEKVSDFFNFALNILKNNKFQKYPELIEKRNKLVAETSDLKMKQIKSLKKSKKGTKVGLLYLEIMTESKNMLLFTTNVIQAQKEFMEYGKRNGIS
jgi:Na+/phosphate symporter